MCKNTHASVSAGTPSMFYSSALIITTTTNGYRAERSRKIYRDRNSSQEKTVYYFINTQTLKLKLYYHQWVINQWCKEDGKVFVENTFFSPL